MAETNVNRLRQGFAAEHSKRHRAFLQKHLPTSEHIPIIGRNSAQETITIVTAFVNVTVVVTTFTTVSGHTVDAQV